MDMIQSLGQAPNEVELSAFETEIGFVLPPTYRAFLKEHNGGEPRVGYFRVPGWGNSVINYFYGLNLPRSLDIRRAIEHVLDIPTQRTAIPLARDPGGNRICMGIGPDNAGRIYFWDHEEYDRPMIELAPDFDAFLAMLTATEQAA